MTFKVLEAEHRQIIDMIFVHYIGMKTPIEQILEGFDGIQLIHLVPMLLVLIPVIIFEVRRRRNPIKTSRKKVWVKGKGFQPMWSIDTRNKDDVADLEKAYDKMFKRN